MPQISGCIMHTGSVMFEISDRLLHFRSMMIQISLIPTENKNELSINPDISRRFKNAMFQISVKYYNLSTTWPKHEITN